jgi:hypothetical protein
VDWESASTPYVGLYHAVAEVLKETILPHI